MRLHWTITVIFVIGLGLPVAASPIGWQVSDDGRPLFEWRFDTLARDHRDIDKDVPGRAGSKGFGGPGAYDSLVRLLSERGRMAAFRMALGRVPGDPSARQSLRPGHPHGAAADPRGAQWVLLVRGATPPAGPAFRATAAATAPILPAAARADLPEVPLQSAMGYMLGGVLLFGAAGRWWRRTRTPHRPPPEGDSRDRAFR